MFLLWLRAAPPSSYLNVVGHKIFMVKLLLWSTISRLYGWRTPPQETGQPQAPPFRRQRPGRPRGRQEETQAMGNHRHLLSPLSVRGQDAALQAPLPGGGKLTTPARLNAVAAGTLVHIIDQLTDRRYLVDTGASFSLVPYWGRYFCR